MIQGFAGQSSQLRAPSQADVALLGAPATDLEPGADLVESELLVEEISIDGMCGVY